MSLPPSPEPGSTEERLAVLAAEEDQERYARDGTVGDVFALISGLSLFGASFMSWYIVRGFFGGGLLESANGWEEPRAAWSQAATLLGLGVVVLSLASIVSQRSGRSVWSHGARAAAYLGASVTIAVCLAIKADAVRGNLGDGLLVAGAATVVLGITGVMMILPKAERA